MIASCDIGNNSSILFIDTNFNKNNNMKNLLLIMSILLFIWGILGTISKLSGQKIIIVVMKLITTASLILPILYWIFLTGLFSCNSPKIKEYNITQLHDCGIIADSLICLGFDSNDAYIIGGFETDLYDEADTIEYQRYLYLCDSLRH